MRRGSWRKVASVGGRQLGLCVYCVRFTNDHCDLLNALSLHTEVDYDYERLLQSCWVLQKSITILLNRRRSDGLFAL